MKTIEIRRHSIRTPPNDHLSQEGVTLARLVGQNLGPFDRVITSTLSRAFETAIAMGFAVDEQAGLLSSNGADVETMLPVPQRFEAYGKAFRHGSAVTVYGKKVAKFYSEVENFLADGRSALVVCHSGVIEISAVSCLPDADHSALGDSLNFCEGVRLSWENGKCVNVEVLRLSI